MTTVATARTAGDRGEPYLTAAGPTPVCGPPRSPGPAGARAAPVRIGADLAPARVAGDPELLERIVANLLDNAVRHDVPDGWVHVATAQEPGRAVLVVANSGPVLPPDEVTGLLEPFRRLGAARTGDGGLGLGLSIVAAIARAHAGTVALQARGDGGLEVRIALPRGT
ncbi:MAG: sensor histidine kinase [Pseudonocardia sp.]